MFKYGPNSFEPAITISNVVDGATNTLTLGAGGITYTSGAFEAVLNTSGLVLTDSPNTITVNKNGLILTNGSATCELLLTDFPSGFAGLVKLREFFVCNGTTEEYSQLPGSAPYTTPFGNS